MKGISITEYIKDRKNYITNLDPDGIFTFILIKKYLDGDIVGFTNSKDYVYLLNGLSHSGSTVTYIDMFVSNPHIHSIDQHIVTRNLKETRQMGSVGSKLNPNLLFEQDLTDYKHKFPLSTFLFVLMMLGEEYEVKIDWHKKIEGTDLELGHFLLDIDGVLTNLIDYNANVKAWMDKLVKECDNHITRELYDYINTIPILELKAISTKVRRYLKETFHTESKDGGYKSINETNVHNIERIISFFSNILFDEPMDLTFNIEGMDIYKGDIGITNTSNLDLIKTFSYAIVRASDNNVSYTTNIRKIN